MSATAPRWSQYDQIYLSPHLDDVVFSCGGAVARGVQAGQRVLVVTVCSKPPLSGTRLSAFAEALHRKWGLRPEECVSARLKEDAAALDARPVAT